VQISLARRRRRTEGKKGGDHENRRPSGGPAPGPGPAGKERATFQRELAPWEKGRCQKEVLKPPFLIVSGTEKKGCAV